MVIVAGQIKLSSMENAKDGRFIGKFELKWKSEEDYILALQMPRAEMFVNEIGQLLDLKSYASAFEARQPAQRMFDHPADTGLKQIVSAYREAESALNQLLIAEQLADAVIERLCTGGDTGSAPLSEFDLTLVRFTRNYRGDLLPAEAENRCLGCNKRPIVLKDPRQCVVCYLNT